MGIFDDDVYGAGYFGAQRPHGLPDFHFNDAYLHGPNGGSYGFARGGIFVHGDIQTDFDFRRNGAVITDCTFNVTVEE